MVRPSSSPTATAFTGLLWPVKGSPMGVPVAASQSRTVLSLLPEATMVRPVQLADRHRAHRTGVAGEGWPMGVPVAASQTRTVLSLLPEATMVRPVQLARPPPHSPCRCGR